MSLIFLFTESIIFIPCVTAQDALCYLKILVTKLMNALKIKDVKQYCRLLTIYNNSHYNKKEIC